MEVFIPYVKNIAMEDIRKTTAKAKMLLSFF
jgi:hypothetical protein